MAEWVHIIALILLAIMNAFGCVLWWVFKENIIRLEKKIDELNQRGTISFNTHCADCRLKLEQQFLGKDDFKELVRKGNLDWKEFWESFNLHKHDEKTGRTLR